MQFQNKIPYNYQVKESFGKTLNWTRWTYKSVFSDKRGEYHDTFTIAELQIHIDSYDKSWKKKDCDQQVLIN